MSPAVAEEEQIGVGALQLMVCVSAGVLAVFDQRSPAADPQRPGLGAPGSRALCGPGGLLTQQVKRAPRAPNKRILHRNWCFADTGGDTPQPPR